MRARSTARGCGRSRRRRSSGRDALGGARRRRRRARRGDRRRLARRGGRRRVRVVEATPENIKVTDPAHDAAALAEHAPVLTDYHVHLRPDDGRAARARYFTRGERRALPRGGGRARHRGARRRRARATASARRSTSGSTRSGARGPSTTSTSTASSCARRPTCSSASRPTSCRAARTGWRTLLDEHDWDYVVGSVHFLRDDAVDMRGEWDVWQRSRRPEQGLAALLRDARRGGPHAACSTSSPTPTS